MRLHKAFGLIVLTHNTFDSVYVWSLPHWDKINYEGAFLF